MDWKNEGKTWSYIELDGSKFAGRYITGKNRREIIREKSYEYKSNNEDATPSECLKYAKDFVRREQKHYKAFVKNKNYFWYKGSKYPVMTESRLDRFKKMAEQLEDKFADMSEEEKENIFLNEEE